MEEPKALESLFKEKIFRIPDYQRGYAWKLDQLDYFWDDLVNLSDNRSHYTGVLTIKEIPTSGIKSSDLEYWLVEDHSYKMYHIVDGQQRLTTFVIFLQALIDVLREIEENTNKQDSDIYITDSLSIDTLISKFLFRTKPSEIFRTYKFGYEKDNPSHDYLRYKILNENGSRDLQDTFYTLNLKNAKTYFYNKIKKLFISDGIEGLRDIYKKLTKRFLFNEYAIKDDFDVFVAFETMNNRGKKLSDLELLKNRLIYLTTLFTVDKIADDERSQLRDSINQSWKEVYYQLGRNEKHPLNDDDYLKAHWTMYFHYSRKRGKDYINYLLDEKFSPKNVHAQTRDTNSNILESPEELHRDIEFDNNEEYDTDYDIENEETVALNATKLQPGEIKEYVDSLSESAVHWFNSHYPKLATSLSSDVQDSIDRLNRLGMGYFRPLVMSILKNEKDANEICKILDHIERFVFIAFRLCRANSNYRDSEFYNASRAFDRGNLTLDEIKVKLEDRLSYCFDSDGFFNSSYFYTYLEKNFSSGSKGGYYNWNGLRYFLYEYELNLHSASRQIKVSWEDLLKSSNDTISIEHIFPQTPTNDWKQAFSGVSESFFTRLSGSLGNLLLLSMSINSSLQNDKFEHKKGPKMDSKGNKTRNGYSDGSHSEIEVSQFGEWTPTQIRERGFKLLTFIEERWKIKFRDIAEKEKLLFWIDFNRFKID